MSGNLQWKENTLLREVERRSGTQVSACFQCHKCSTGCPVAPEMDYLSSQIMRLIHYGEETDVLESKAIWICSSCETCTTRCPMGIDIAGTMDTLRIMAVERKASVADTRTKRFNKEFLRSVRWHSRVFEFGMMALYKLTSLDLFSDIDKIPKMLAKRKLALRPHFSRSSKEVRPIFKRAEEEEKKR